MSWKITQEFGSYGCKNGQFDSPRGIAVSKTNKIFIADTLNHRIQVLDREGVHLYTLGRMGSAVGEFIAPFDVDIDDLQGLLYVADTGNNRIQAMRFDGSNSTTFGGRGSGDGQFLLPRSITVIPGAQTSSPQVLVVDSGNNRIQHFERQILADGSVQYNLLSKIGDQQDPQTVLHPFQYPCSASVMPNILPNLDNFKVLITDSFNNRVQIWHWTSPLWTFSQIIGGNQINFNVPQYASAHANEMKVTVIDTCNSMIKTFEQKLGEYFLYSTIGGYDSNDLRLPSKMAIIPDETGNGATGYMIDTLNHRYMVLTYSDVPNNIPELEREVASDTAYSF